MTSVALDPVHALLLEMAPALKSLPGFMRELRAAVEAKQTVTVLPNEHLEAALSELATVLRNQPAPAAAAAVDLSPLQESLEELGKRITKPVTYSVMGGGGGAREETLLDLKRGVTDARTRFDFDGRDDTNPVYVGRFAPGETDGVIEKWSYDAEDPARATDAQALTGAWSDRASLNWE